MDTVMSDHQQSSVVEKIDSGLTAEFKPQKKKATLSKGDSRYWTEGRRLFKNHGAAEYSCRFTTLNRREHFNLGSQNKKTAAAKAAEIYSHIQANGWESAIDRYKPKAPPKSVVSPVTVGEFIEAATKESSARKQTRDGYAKAFRLIVSEVRGICGDGKFDAYKGGLIKWQAKVDAVAMDTITPAEILAWKNKRLRGAETDPLAKRRAIVTVNSHMRNAKSLFGKKVLPFVERLITLPRPLPFDGVALEKEPSLRYISKIDPIDILAKARDELAKNEPEAYKVMILALYCGLRRAEIDNLLWCAFDFPNSSIRVESSEFHELKSEDSAGEIDLDADTLALFKAYQAKKPKAIFVVESPLKHDSNAKVGRYRCEPVFKKVIAWLRKHGVDGYKPLHTLRKEIGSVIASESGIFEASRFLRHADIHITSAYYADKKNTITPKAFAGLLSSTEPDAEFWELTPAKLGAKPPEVTLEIKRRVDWPDKKALKKLVWQKPLIHAAKDIGVSDVALKKHCVKLGIELPRRGYWVRA
jgi:integrase